MVVSGCTVETCRDGSGLNALMKQNRDAILAGLVVFCICRYI